MAREYKDSGIEWIGQIPKEWEVSKLKYLTTLLQSGGTPTSSNASLYCEDGTSWVAIGDMRHCGEISYTQKHLTDEGLKEKSLIVFPVGTLLYSIYASVGKVSILGIPAAINQAILAISLNEKAKQEYVKFVLTSMENYVFSLANGNTQFNLNAGIVSNFVLPLPSLLSQQKIADYLDKVCGEVDEMVALQETMIEELKAYKQSVITEAVTKGLNPNAPMRNSGIDWIGEIPEHWDFARVGLFYFVTKLAGFEYTDTLMNKISSSDVVPIVRAQNVRMFRFEKESISEYIDLDTSLQLDRCSLNKKSLLMTFIGAGIGDVCIFNEPKRYHLAPNVAKIEKNSDYDDIICDEYIMYYHGSDAGKGEINKISKASAQASLSMSTIRRIAVVIPPMSEQQQIVCYLDAKCNEIDSLVALKQAKIEELNDYKKSVIYEYVTGKKEVV